ncbi:MAG: class II aldolase/adducin family protein [Verrucomicrobiae bacterium]|nr:class II aldolase/adducin family protein [Verrucomicrobiae bacterium]
MPTVITAKDVEALIGRGEDPATLPADAILTPSARDVLRDWRGRNGAGASGGGAGSGEPLSQTARAFPKPVSAASSPEELEAFFRSGPMETLKEQICDIGRRLWQREYVDGNGGNIAIRVADDLALCTPTLVSKGFMKPADMCLVDLEGTQKAGRKKRTSEILMHLQIMKRQPRAKATVHCHPPYSTGFAVAGVAPPTCMIPEYEVFASVAVAPYRTPGTPEMGQLVAELVDKHNTVLMANHGVVAWSHLDVEDAYFKMEILEAYCRTILVSAQLGKPPNTMTPAQLQDLLKIKQGLGIPDPRHGLKECELCDNNDWRPGVVCALPAKPSEPAAPEAGLDPEAEAVVKAVTDQILRRLG